MHEAGWKLDLLYLYFACSDDPEKWGEVRRYLVSVLVPKVAKILGISGDDEALARQCSYFDESDRCTSDSPSGRKCKRTSWEHDREGGGAVRLSWNEGAVWAGSSRKKAMSTGSCGPRGPGGQLSALTSQPITLKAHADRVECPPERRGGFMPG